MAKDKDKEQQQIKVEIQAATATLSPCAAVDHQNDIDAVQKQMFFDFCTALEERGIPYVILAGYRDYPEKIAPDVDFMVSEDDFNRLPAILNDPACVLGARIVQILQHETSARYYVLAKQVGSRVAYLHLNSTANYRLDTRLWLRSDSVLAARRKLPTGFWIPAAAVAFEYYFVKQVEKPCVETPYLEQLSALQMEDAAGCRTVLVRLAPADIVDSITAAISSHDVAWFEAQCVALKKMLSCNVTRESAFRRLRSQYEELLRLARRILSPTGFIIAVLGPDGTGKTTNIIHLTKEFSPAFRRAKHFGNRPHYVPLGAISTGPTLSDPHGETPRGRLASTLKIGLFLADYWFGWLKYVQPAKVRSSLITFDRYYHDMLVDTKRYRLPSGFSLPRRLAPLIPQPDLWLILTTQPELLVARKGEISLAEAQQLTVAYQALARDLPCVVVIDTSKSLDHTLVSAVTAVLERLESRAQDILKRLP